jgi:hypothetical protein
MSEVKVSPGHGHGTRVSVRLKVDTWSAPKPADLIADITNAVAALMSNGIASDDARIDVDLDCNPRDGHELTVEVYGYRPNTKAEAAKISRERNAEKKKQAEWHRAQLARLEDS